MFIRISAVILVFFLHNSLFAQQAKPIKVIEERTANRIMLYALNESDIDYDVLITVEGTNFRQSRSQVRPVRVPAITKVHLKNLVLQRGKQPNYTYKLTIDDSLSRRSLIRPAEKIKIDPKHKVVVYRTPNCTQCNEMFETMANSKYNFTFMDLAENEELNAQMVKLIPSLDEMTNPLVSIGGSLLGTIESYDQLIAEINK